MASRRCLLMSEGASGPYTMAKEWAEAGMLPSVLVTGYPGPVNNKCQWSCCGSEGNPVPTQQGLTRQQSTKETRSSIVLKAESRLVPGLCACPKPMESDHPNHGTAPCSPVPFPLGPGSLKTAPSAGRVIDIHWTDEEAEPDASFSYPCQNTL